MFAKGMVFWFVFLAFVLSLSSCTISPPSAQPTESAVVLLTPFHSPTPSATLPVKTTIVVTPTNLPTPTPTPVVYTIVEGDTMLAIALRNGISLEELQAANPEVNPRLLSVGTELIIPLGEVIPASPMTATPVPINIASTDCYIVPDGIWCFLRVKNDSQRELENLTARVVVFDEDEELVVEGVAVAALNKLLAETEMPLNIFFPGSFSGEIAAHTTVLSAQRVPKNDERYLNAWLEEDEIELADGETQAKVSGRYGIPKKSLPGKITWILGTAYDDEGNVVGVRKIEEIGFLEPGTSQDFSLDIFSLGPRIAEVKILVEIRPE
jgi:LysM repeat protein